MFCCDFEKLFARYLWIFGAAYLDVSETGKPIFASRFTGQASRTGNISGNIHANPPTSMKSSDPVFKPFFDVRGSPWTRLGITGVRLPSPPSRSS